MGERGNGGGAGALRSSAARASRRSPSRTVLAAALLALAACETVPDVDPVADPARVYEARRAAVAALPGWTLSARLALVSPQDSSTVGVRWAQRGEGYRLRLSAALGQGLVEIEGEPGAVTMRTADERTVVAESAEALLYAETGWRVPVAGLRHWVLGVAQPDTMIDAAELDAAGRLAELEQAGWTIRYLDWERVDGTDMPARIFMETEGLEVRLAVSGWELGT